MDFSKVTSKKYVEYFLSVDESSINDEIMDEFLNKMIESSESLYEDEIAPPIEVIKEIKTRLGLDDNIYIIITQIVSSDLIDSLSSLEVFTLLWFISCKNVFCFEKGVYYNMTKNKTIGKLLKKLASFQ
ncbi:MAG: hypothetical protein IJ400_05755 [Clostridia bacterium]|nr:hypothetical protein [Clostridia bacterium]